MSYVLATNKIWHPKLAENLEKSTAKKIISIHVPEELTEARLNEIQPEYIFFPHWSHIIPPAIYTKFECIIFHMTDLPFGRGGSPLQNLIANGIYSTQISALRCEENVDSGPIYLKKPLSLQGNAQDIYKQAHVVIEEMIIDIIQKKMTPVPQQGEVVKFARRKPEESNLIALDELSKVYDFIRMLDAESYPRAFLETEHFKFEFSRASFQEDKILADVLITAKRKNK